MGSCCMIHVLISPDSLSNVLLKSSSPFEDKHFNLLWPPAPPPPPSPTSYPTEVQNTMPWDCSLNSYVLESLESGCINVDISCQISFYFMAFGVYEILLEQIKSAEIFSNPTPNCYHFPEDTHFRQ